MARSPYVEAPPSWTRVSARGPAPFVTQATYRRGDGTLARWESRAHRKRHNRLDARRGSTWWAPGAVAWWIGVLFAIGSLCFAVGALPGFVGLVGSTADDVTFFVGSVFFTSAALLQYLEVVNAAPATIATPARRVRLLSWEPHRIDWCAAAIQLVGTLFFNRSTFNAIHAALSASQAKHTVWRPDALGSVCFLVASGLAWAEAGHGWLSWRPSSLSWRIAALNLGGSIAFGVSAIAARVVPDSGAPHNAPLANLGTFVGALGFLVGAVLLLPERTQPPPPAPDRSPTSDEDAARSVP